MKTVAMDSKPSTRSAREQAQHLFKKNAELDKALQRSAQAKVPSDPNVWDQMRDNYEKIVLEDQQFSEKHEVDYLLWQLHYRRIEEFRLHLNATTSNVSAGGKGGPVRPEKIRKVRSMFKSFLTEASGFYHDLMLKIGAKYGLHTSLFTGCPESQFMVVEQKKSADFKRGLVSCHRCLIYLGDLARYKEIYGEADAASHDYASASSYYSRAISLCPSSGNSHHQLAILASYSGNDLLALYRYFRSLAVEIPFRTARDNLIIAFEKNRQRYVQLHDKMKVSSGRRSPTWFSGRGRGKGDRRLMVKDVKTVVEEQNLDMHEVLKTFSTRFVRLNGILFTRTSLEAFGEVLSSVTEDLNVLVATGPDEELNFGPDVADNALVMLRLIAILVFTVHNEKKELENLLYKENLQRNVLLQNAFTAIFMFAGHILKRCSELRDASTSYLLPSILVLVEWLACNPDIAVGFNMEDEQAFAWSFFWKHCVFFMNKLISTGLASIDGQGDETCFINMSSYVEGETDNRLALWEDFELRGFLPLVPAHILLDFSSKHLPVHPGSTKDRKSRAQRILAAGQSLSGTIQIDQYKLYIDPNVKKFVVALDPPASNCQADSDFSSSADSSDMEQLNQVQDATDIGVKQFGASSFGEAKMNLLSCLNGEVDGEEIVFKPTVAPSTACGVTNSLQVSSQSDWTVRSTELSAPVDNVQHSTVSNTNSQLHSAVGNASQMPLQYVNPGSSSWLMKQELLYDGMNNINNGFSNEQMLLDSLGPIHSSFLSAHMNLDTGVLPLQIKASQLFPSSFDTVMPPKSIMPISDNLGMKPSAPITTVLPVLSKTLQQMPSSLDAIWLPQLTAGELDMKLSLQVPRRTPVSRPVKHQGPPPGYISASELAENVSDSGLMVKPPEEDDYSWLDGYVSSSPKGLGVDNSFGQATQKFLQVIANNSTDFESVTNFPFPGKQIFNVDNHVQGQKLQDFCLFELKPYEMQNHLENLHNAPYPGQRHTLSLWSGLT